MMTRRMFTQLFAISAATVSFSNSLLATLLPTPSEKDSSVASEVLIVNGWICTREDLKDLNPGELAQLRAYENSYCATRMFNAMP